MRGDFIFLVAIITLFASCQQHSFEDKKALLDYIKNPDNGYLQEKSVNSVDFSLLYRPTDLLVAQELSPTPSQEEIDSLRKKYGDYLYFNLSLSQNGKELLSSIPNNQIEFGAMVNKLAFGMDQSIHCFNEKRDTIPMIDYVYPRMYGMSSSSAMILIYPRNDTFKNSEEINISIKDFGIQTGEVRFSLDPKKIQEQPNIILTANL